MSDISIRAADILADLETKKHNFKRRGAKPAPRKGCEKCEYTGFIVEVRVYNDGTQIPQPMKPCACQREILAARAAEVSGLKPEDYKRRFDQLDEVREQAEALNAIQTVLKRGYGWVFLESAPGRGKSELLLSAVAEALAAGMSALWFEMPQMLDTLQLTFDEPNSSTKMRAHFARWRGVKLLAIDEADKFNPTPWRNEQVQKLLSHRYITAKRQETITLIASNEPSKWFAEYIDSRAWDNEFYNIYIQGDDLREKGV